MGKKHTFSLARCLPSTIFTEKGAGFTLIEILIALAIASLIFTIIYGAYAASIDTMNYTRQKMETFSITRLTLSRMNDELTSSFLSDNESLRFLGEEGKIGFVSAFHERIFRDSKEYDLVEIGYFTEPDEAGGEERFLLWRREDRTPDDDVLAGGVKEKLLDDLTGIEFQYYDGEEWRLVWDSEEEGRLPQAVKATLKFPDQELSTLAYLPLWKLKSGR